MTDQIFATLGITAPTDGEARSLRYTRLALTFVLAMWLGLEVGSRIWP